MFSAVLIACLATAPTECSSYEMELREWHPLMQMVEAQTWASQWLDAHPRYVKKDLRVVRGQGV